jgi:hypothetical protein
VWSDDTLLGLSESRIHDNQSRAGFVFELVHQVGAQMNWLTEISQRLNAATPGPWHKMCVFGSWDLPISIENDKGLQVFEVNGRFGVTDADLIAHAPTDIAHLLDALRVASEALELITGTLVPYAPESDEGIALEAANSALARIEKIGESSVRIHNY